MKHEHPICKRCGCEINVGRNYHKKNAKHNEFLCFRCYDEAKENEGQG